MLEKHKDFSVSFHVFSTHCHCGSPKHLSQVLQCNHCNKLFHSHCYLIRPTLAVDISNFQCYSCMNHGFHKEQHNIEKASGFLEQILPSKMSRFYHLVQNVNPAFSSTVNSKMEYEELSLLLESYNLFEIVNGKGEIYNRLLMVCNNLRDEFRFCNKFETLNVA